MPKFKIVDNRLAHDGNRPVEVRLVLINDEVRMQMRNNPNEAWQDVIGVQGNGQLARWRRAHTIKGLVTTKEGYLATAKERDEP